MISDPKCLVVVHLLETAQRSPLRAGAIGRLGSEGSHRSGGSVRHGIRFLGSVHRKIFGPGFRIMAR